jgi:aminoglycoside 6'-N-acetyltransferase I
MNYRNLGDKTAIIGIKICDFTEQNKGYGTVLLTAFIDALFRHMGYETIDIDTNLTNTRAQKVYEQKLGFRKICVNENSWKNQLGELQSQVCYKLSKNDWLVAHSNVDYVYIRRADISDLSLLTPMTLTLYSGDHIYDDLAEENSALLSSGNDAVFLAFDGEKAVGFSHISLRHDYVDGTEGGAVGYLEGIYVDEDYRDRGIAHALVSAGEQWAKNQGCKEFASDCQLDNTDSLQFHLKLGFTETGRIICFKKSLED